MKVIQLNTFESDGGAARAASRIHRALREIGVSSEMLVARKKTDDSHVKPFVVPRQERKLRFVNKLLDLQKSSNPTFHSCNLFSSGIAEQINNSDANMVNFHWICNELIGIPEVSRITKPVVWTIHDMWAFSGAEHYEDVRHPGRYRETYRRSNRREGKWLRPDIDGWVWRRKRKYWKNIDFHFVTPSNWLAACLKESELFSERRVTVIPNCIDIKIFKPVNTNEARKQFGLRIDKRLILFGADYGDHNPIKGYHLLKEALRFIAEDDMLKDQVECIVFGGLDVCDRVEQGIPIHELGRIEDDNLLASLYSLADIFVTPSMIDNLPNTVMEALSCGTACVAFDVGGMSDLILHQKNGYLAQPFDTKELAQGITWALRKLQKGKEMEENARNHVLENYTPKLVASQYERLYTEILKSAPKK